MKIGLLLMIALFGLAASPSYACLPMPLEMRNDFLNDAASRLLTQGHTRLDKMSKISVKFENTKVIKYEWIKTNPGFECRDKETLSTDVTINFESGVPSGFGCEFKGTVKKVEGFYENAPRATYEFTNVSTLCE